MVFLAAVAEVQRQRAISNHSVNVQRVAPGLLAAPLRPACMRRYAELVVLQVLIELTQVVEADLRRYSPGIFCYVPR
ncbi:hypothetical protein D3C74_210520 [compost metagenome]